MRSTAERCQSVAAVAPLAPVVERLREGGLVAYPTETVWGLAALAGSDRAVGALIAWKGRQSDQPLSLLVPDSAGLEALGVVLAPLARRIVESFWPGPLTLVLPGPPTLRLARGIARKDGAVGFRCSSHPVAASLAGALLRAGLSPVTATSLNRSGQPPVRARRDAVALCAAAGRASIEVLLAPGEAGGDPPSTVVELLEDRARILRWGAVGRAAFEERMGRDSGSEESA